MIVKNVSEDSLTEAIDYIAKGEVIAHATETCYGLACDLTNPSAVEKLFRIKQRPSDQPVSALFASVEQARQYIEWNEEIQKLADQFLPGPLTIVANINTNSPHQIYPKLAVRQGSLQATSNQKLVTIGMRISSHSIAQQLAEAYPHPLSTTSANLHSLPNPYSAEDMVEQFGEQEFQPDLILDSGTLPEVPPSTIVDMTVDPPKVLRQGSEKVL